MLNEYFGSFYSTIRIPLRRKLVACFLFLSGVDEAAQQVIIDD
jgi:hypothetical protein